jgi:hypothetical protein
MQNFNWETEIPHVCNTETMSHYLENYLESDFNVIMQDGSYAEIQLLNDGKVYAVHASGNGILLQ